ncbi:PREDICTED: uroplakin-3a isoform X3 [Hipposideros armiger]|uniref:Uroplakin-3a isoform X3 n=1 Tax=Hipposideros armiger TaxID=186990 RepID=A0A8B7S1K8_HIPAR|nr:PREDICTED: uroplakin-3a isoform X3 [Hipposideros armiger]
MPPLWALLALGCLRLCSGVNLQPQMASVTFATNNPTLSTVALEKPLCMFDSTVALSGPYQVYLYVLVDSASSRNASVQDDTQTPLSSTFQQTDGGRTGPYKASAFDLAPCSDLPSLAAVGDVSRASEILNAYLIRVGTNVACLSDPNFQSVCNPPLSAATEYRISPTSLWPELTGWVEVILTPSPSRFNHPVLGNRHVAGPAKWRHDRGHLHPGLPALLPAPGLCRCHCPQPHRHGRF